MRVLLSPSLATAVHCANNASKLRAILSQVGANGVDDEVRIRNVAMPARCACSTDLARVPRVAGRLVDIGAHEFERVFGHGMQ